MKTRRYFIFVLFIIVCFGFLSYLGRKNIFVFPTPKMTLEPFIDRFPTCPVVIYTTQADDTLKDIAYNYRIPIESIKKYNGLSSDTIIPGMQLGIQLCRAPFLTLTPVPGFFGYVVQQGDTCLKIAEAFDVSVESIVAVNNLSKGCGDLYTGQVIKIYPSASSH